jgi:hypothetical protein
MMRLEGRTRRAVLVLAMGTVGWQAWGPLVEVWATWQQVALLGDPDAGVRARAAAELRLRGSEANRLLIGQIRVGNAQARAEACRLLAKDTRRKTDVLEALIWALADPDDAVAQSAALALAAPRREHGKGALAARRKGEDNLAVPTGSLGVEPEVPGWPAEPPRVQVAAALRTAAGEGRTPDVRVAAIHAVAGWCRHSSRETACLVAALDDADSTVVVTAARGLLAWRRDEARAVSALRRILATAPPEPMAQAIERVLATYQPASTETAAPANPSPLGVASTPAGR